jgi:hypothetical protein
MLPEANRDTTRKTTISILTKTTAMKRITPKQKQIIEMHLESARTGNWNEPKTSREEVINGLRDGATYEGIHQEIVSRYVSITSQLYASPSVFGHTTGAYKKDYTKGFKILLNNLNIN